MSAESGLRERLITAAFESERASYLLLIIYVLGLPLFMEPSAASEVIIFAIFAVGYNIILGFGGQLSFGHAAFFGGGAYAVMVVFNHFIPDLLLSICVGLIVVFVLSLVYGWVSLRRRDLALALITLGLAQVTYFIIYQWGAMTGGSDGMGFPITEMSIAGLFDPTQSTLAFYAFAAVLLILTWIGTRRLLVSPFGRAIIAIRENEERAKALGYNTDRMLLIAFVISGVFSGLAGILYAIHFKYLTPSLVGWQLSGEIVLIALLGGLGTLAGPVIGATAFIFLEDLLTTVITHWEIGFGAAIIVVVAFAPQGIYGRVQEAVQEGVEPGSLIERVRSRFFE